MTGSKLELEASSSEAWPVLKVTLDEIRILPDILHRLVGSASVDRTSLIITRCNSQLERKVSDKSYSFVPHNTSSSDVGLPRVYPLSNQMSDFI
jgi:hypothetical protein